MLVVGLTGNIASGKSTVAARFATHGARVIDSDLLAREAVAPGTPALARIVEHWGPHVVAADGTLDRSALRRLVFEDPAALAALNAVVHPEVERRRQALLAAARAEGERIVVCDIPLLFETGLDRMMDVVVLVDAPRPLRLARLLHDRALSAADAEAMLDAQRPADAKREQADYVIDNAGSPEALALKADEVWRALVARAAPPPGAAAASP